MATRIFSHIGLAFLVLALNATAAMAQERERGRGRPQPPASEEKAEAQTPDAKAAPETPPKKLLAITGGEIHTVTGEVIRRGTVLVEDGKIKAVGRDISIPEGAEVIDASGKVITPGFVAINMSNLGLRGSPTGNNKIEDALDPFDRNMKFALGVGITSGCVEIQTQQGGRGRRRDSDPDPINGNLLASTPQNTTTSISTSTDATIDEDADSANDEVREVTITELLGYDRREGEPEHRFLGIDPEFGDYVTESQLDYGIENTQLCPCCGLPILPTEPITETPPSQEQPRRHAAIKLAYGNLDDMFLKDNVFYSPAPGGLSGALNRHNWRRDIRKAREEMEKAASAANRPAEAPSATPPSGATGDPRGGTRGTRPTAGSGGAAAPVRPSATTTQLMPLLKKEVSLRVTANTVTEIRDMVALAEELDYDLVVEGGIEAWVAAQELSRSGATVIFTPRQKRDPRLGEEDTSGSSIESTGMFEAQGVPFATAALSNSVSMGGIAGRDLTSLPLEAAMAVRGGASNRKALESITIIPARMMGLDDRIGSIEVGKDADLLILNGDPLDYRTYVEQAIVAGKICYDRATDQVYPVYDRK
jgi:hypothetical protein